MFYIFDSSVFPMLLIGSRDVVLLKSVYLYMCWQNIHVSYLNNFHLSKDIRMLIIRKNSWWRKVFVSTKSLVNIDSKSFHCCGDSSEWIHILQNRNWGCMINDWVTLNFITNEWNVEKCRYVNDFHWKINKIIITQKSDIVCVVLSSISATSLNDWNPILHKVTKD